MTSPYQYQSVLHFQPQIPAVPNLLLHYDLSTETLIHHYLGRRENKQLVNKLLRAALHVILALLTVFITSYRLKNKILILYLHFIFKLFFSVIHEDLT